jgi:hypothetical protein
MLQGINPNRAVEIRNHSRNSGAVTKTLLKGLFCLLLLFSAFFSYGQEKTVIKTPPPYILKVNDSAKDFVVQMINGEKI